MSAKDKNDKTNISYNKVGKGEYELHILVQSTSGLSLEGDGSIDVKIAITAFGKTEYTKVKNDIGVEETFWGEHFYFTKNYDQPEMAENDRVLICIYDYNRLMANTLVGSYEIDIQRIYSEKNHTLQHTWLALSNMERNFKQITGYIKISTSLLGQKDQNIELEVQPIASITKQKKVLVPPQIQRKTYQVIVDVLQGKDIKPADGTTVDSYIGFEFGQIFSVSETIPKNCFPKYSTRVYLPMSLPAVVENIALRLNDFNFIQKVQLLGSYYLNINDLLKQMNGPLLIKDSNTRKTNSVFEQKIILDELKWVNFYGPQKNTKNEDQKNVQQFYPALAPYYTGSVLMKVSMKESSDPISRNQKLSTQIINRYNKQLQQFPPTFYQIQARITAALNLFQRNKKHKILIKIGPQQNQTQLSQAKNGFCFWNIAKRFTITVNPLQVIPDIFIYLVDDKNNKTCYLRYKPKQGIILQDQWVKLIPDNANVSYKGQQAGYIKLGLSMVPTIRKQPEATKSMNSNLASMYTSNKKSGRLVIDLLCADSLIPLDEEGSIDSFFTFNYMQSQVTSTVKNDSLNPIFYERLIIQTDIMDQQSCPPIIVNAWDKDKFQNQFLGSTFIDVSQALRNKSLVYAFNANPQPFWYTVENNGLVAGKFLATFRVLPNYNQFIPKQINIPKKTYEMTLVVMGLRGLKNSSVISVKQPFIQFDFAGLDVYKAATKQIKNKKLICTQPKEKGRSININTVIPAKINLPQNYKYWPSLSARVKDNVLGQFYQPVLGYFSINLQKSYLRSQNVKQQFKNKQRALLQNKAAITQKPAKMKNVNDTVLMSMRNFIIKSLNYNWKVAGPDMANQLNRLSKNPDKRINQDFIVIFPYYERQVSKVKKDQNNQEVNDTPKYVQMYKDIIVNNGQYMQIGYDNTAMRTAALSKRNKHYRYVLNQPYQNYYERVYGLKMGAMDQIPIRIGRVFTAKDTISNIIRKISKQDTQAGTYKGQLFITQYNERQNSIQEEQFRNTSKSLLNLLTQKGKCHMFLYIIQAANLPPKDQFSNSDPYLVVKSNKQKLSFEKQYFNDQPNPQFFKKVHMILQFPQDSSIDIQIWDYDPVKADQLIGTVTIDIQNRVSSKLRDISFNHPIQTHNLTHETSKRPQGLIRFWLDLVSLDNISLYRQFQIANKQTSNFQIRVIVWNVQGMPNNDIQDMSDLYATCQFNGATQQTDVHYRSATGEGNFNWRMVFPIKLPVKNPMITFKVFDKDIVTRNDYLASASFSIQKYLDEVFQTDNSMTLFLGTQDLSANSDLPGSKSHTINGTKYYDRFNIDMMNRIVQDKNKINKQGKLQISMEILTDEQAKRKPVGKGRDTPNQYPYLPPPKKRFQFSLNPMKMISQLCGPQFKKQIAIALCLLLFLGTAIYFAVAFGGSVVGSIVGTKAAA